MKGGADLVSGTAIGGAGPRGVAGVSSGTRPAPNGDVRTAARGVAGRVRRRRGGDGSTRRRRGEEA